MTDKTYSARVGEKLIYPTWKSLLLELPHTKEGKNVGLSESRNALEDTLMKVDAIRRKNAGFSPELVQQLMQNARANYHKGIPIEEIKRGLDEIQLGTNEFYTIYDIQKARYTYVSERVGNVLGISPDSFSVDRMYAMLPDGGLHHPEDVHHILRWGNLAYAVTGIPGFHFRANDDHYLVRHRMSTATSNRPEIRELEYVLVEKRCYLCHVEGEGDDLQPSMHLDRWTVLNNVRNHYVRPHFVTSPDQSLLMNGTLYFLNALLIGIPVKYVMLLNERQEFDRNKAIANSINEKIKHYSGVQADLDDKNVADCFSKTIRSRVRDALNTWLPADKEHRVQTDTDAVRGVMKLGILPVPPIAEQLMYSSVTEV